MKEHIKILPSPFLRDVRTELRVLEYNREMIALYMILVGAVLVVVAIIW